MKIENGKAYLSFGEIMQIARKKAGYSVRGISNEVGSHRNAIYKMEHDCCVINTKLAYQLCKKYGVSLDTMCKIGFEGVAIDASEVIDEPEEEDLF